VVRPYVPLPPGPAPRHQLLPPLDRHAPGRRQVGRFPGCCGLPPPLPPEKFRHRRGGSPFRLHPVLLSPAIKVPLLSLFRYWQRHPIARRDLPGTVRRFLRWQLGTRLLKMPVVVPWIGPTSLVIERGMTGATMNVYCGLHEAADMASPAASPRPTASLWSPSRPPTPASSGTCASTTSPRWSPATARPWAPSRAACASPPAAAP
jgi:hypothetical protein